MLKNFIVFECRNPNNTPCCRALLCVGKSPATCLAYAWVDTVQAYGDITITPVHHANEITVDTVIESINRLCDTQHSSQDEAVRALNHYLIMKAEEKLAVRERWYVSQGRKYRTSAYATHDAAWAAIPVFPLQELNHRLKAERDGEHYTPPSQAELLQGISEIQTRWTWENDYVEPEGMLNMIKCHVTEVPLKVVHKHPSAASRIRKHYKETRTRTPKSRLMYLMELAETMPVMNYKGYQSIVHKIKFPWHELVPKWFILNPAPLNSWDAARMAKLDYDDKMHILADQMSWLHHWYVLQAAIRNDDVGDEVEVFTWNVDKQEMVSEPVTYDADEEWFLCQHT